MDALKDALHRLGAAAERLENAVEAREGRGARREAELTEALRAARDERDRAQANAETVSQRLEAAIGRLEAVLESETPA